MPHPSARPAASRRALLAGVSMIALCGGPARAGAPPLFSPAWFAARGDAARAGAAVAASGTGLNAASLQQAQRATTDLARSAQQLRQTLAAQAALARPATVANGLVPGGLEVAPDAGSATAPWTGADRPVQAAAGARTAVTVLQRQAQAVLTWKTFNVGQQTDLGFDQTQGGAAASSWVVLNQVRDPAAQPSRILGSIRAAGKVLVVNANGVIFGAGSQVNVGALIASSASIDATRFTASGLYGAASGSSFTPSFTGALAASAIVVEAGAAITTAAPAAVTDGGGYVLLMGGSVANAGAITTPQGQTALAAGDSFILRQGISTSGNTTSTTRGIEVATVTGGSVANTGIIQADRGDITLAGRSVTQGGVAIATSSVDLRGTIHLLTALADTAGRVTLAQGSVTAVLPEDGTATALDSQRSAFITQSAAANIQRLAAASPTNPLLNNRARLADRQDLSRIEISSGGAVEFAAGSLAQATGGQLAVSAGSRVLVDGGARLDVAGSQNAVLPAGSLALAVTIQPYELRDAPANRDLGRLNSATVYVDPRTLTLVPASSAYPTDRYYTGGGLLEVSGYLNTTGHSIAEWTAPGGSVTLAAAEVVTQPGSSIDLRGGTLSAAGGSVRTSWLTGVDGRLYSVNTAPATTAYTGVFTGFAVDHPRWGITDTYAAPVVAPAERPLAAYTVGRDAGSLTLSTPTAVLEGQILAGVSTGTMQHDARPAGANDGYTLPQSVVARPGGIAIGSYAANGLVGAFATDVRIADDTPAIAASLAVDTALPAGRVATAWLPATALSAAGLGGLAVATAGALVVAAPLELAPGGTLSLSAPSVTVQAGLTARGGAVALGDVLTTVAGPAPIATKGSVGVTVQAGVTLDLRGLWTNAARDPGATAGLAYLNGGSVSIDGSQAVSLAAGSVIDVSSGGAISATRAIVAGAGGNVSITGDDPAYGVRTAPVTLGATVRGYGGKGGGTLAVTAPDIAIGGDGGGDPLAVALDASLFQTGFTAYAINGATLLSVAAGAQVAASVPVYQAGAASLSAPTGTDPAGALDLVLPPLYAEDPFRARLTQRAGASLTLSSVVNAGGATARGGAITVGAGATLAVDPGQSIRLEGFGQITVNGTLSAQGGSIRILNDRVEDVTVQAATRFVAGLSVWIGAAGRLDVAGRAVTAADRLGRPYGIAPAGGTVVLGSAGGLQANGFTVSTDALVILRPGAVVDASGSAATIDLLAGRPPGLNALSPGQASSRVAIAGDGGSIALSSYSGIFLDGTLRAAAGGPGAAGGGLSLTLENPPYRSDFPLPDSLRQPRAIVIATDGKALLAGDLAPGDATPEALIGQARLATTQVAAGGFDTVSLFAHDVLAFDGDVTLAAGRSVTLLQGILAETDPAGHATVAAPSVRVSGFTDHNFDATLATLSVNGTAWKQSTIGSTATLSVSADLIDIANLIHTGVSGTIALTGGATRKVDYAGFAQTGFASGGDIRFASGILVTQGSLSFTAAQIYPVTGATATAFAGYDYTASTKANAYAGGTAITLARTPGTDPAPPVSVGGSLGLFANVVNQGAVLRAPEGSITLGTVGVGPNVSSNTINHSTQVNLLPGSVTSVSAAGQTLLYGGTTDDVTYSYNRTPVSAVFNPSITLQGEATSVAAGATIDLSGGGTLAGAAFISGRGGSVDTLTTPLQSFTPGSSTATVHTLATNPVYAVIPGAQPAYAPISPIDQGGAYASPAPGQTITLATPAGGLAAGTYTLLPSWYALLPGAFRVELDAARPGTPGAVSLGNGSVVVAGYRGQVAGGLAPGAPVSVTLTPGSVVRSYALYQETSYSQFQIDAAARTGNPRPALPIDGKTLTLGYVLGTRPALVFNGAALFQPAPGGRGGAATVTVANAGATGPPIEITPGGATPTPGYVSLNAPQLNALGASRLVIGGSLVAAADFGAPTLRLVAASGSVTVREGAVLGAPEILITAQGRGITVEPGAIVSTLGYGRPPVDTSDGFYFNSFGNTVLAASNGLITFTPNQSSALAYGPITISDGAAIYAGGTIHFETTNSFLLDAGARYGARRIDLSVARVNVGSDAALATAVVPDGLSLNQDILSRLLAGDPSVGAPALERLTLTATQSINLLGSVALDTLDPATGRSSLQQFVLDTPAIYGFGGPGDTATITAGTLVLNGVLAQGNAGSRTVPVSATPGGIVTNGPGSGSGTLNVVAQEILLGWPDQTQPNGQVSLGRVIMGFATVNLLAAQQITANNQGSLSVYLAPGAGGPGQPGVGGDLNLVTPILTGQAGSLTRIVAGGAINLSPGAAPAAGLPAALPSGLGATLDLVATSIADSSAIVLPGGRLTMTTGGDIALGAGARIDLAGRPTIFNDQIRVAPGGTVVLESRGGSIIQDAGAVIDVSAAGAAPGSLSVTAASGTVALAGAIRGGGFDLRAGTLADFAGLNQRLDAGGVAVSRSFEIAAGDLVIGDGLAARSVSVSLDAGSLTVAGTIDARGPTPGTIRLAAGGDLTIAATGRLLAAATAAPRTDSYGAVIDAENTPRVTLTSAAGTLSLVPGAVIDVGSMDQVARGQVVLNAPRRGAGDIAVSAPSGITLNGAASVALYGFASYAPADGLVTQALLDQIDQTDTRPFMAAAAVNADLATRLAGLSGPGFHLRPGVQITGTDLAVSGDINLAGYRYGAAVDPNVAGSGEPGSLVLRASGNLLVGGSITDGFLAPADSATARNPDDTGWVLFSGQEPYGADVTVPAGLAAPLQLASGTSFSTANDVALGYDITIGGGTLGADVVIPSDVTVGKATGAIPTGGWVATAAIVDAAGAVQFAAGELIPAGVSLPVGWTVRAGSVLPFTLSVASGTVWRAGGRLQLFTGPSVALADTVTLAAGDLIPAGSSLKFLGGAKSLALRPTVDGVQGAIYAIAQMLPAGSQSWSITAVAGANPAAADPRALSPSGTLGGSGNLTLGDLHYTSAKSSGSALPAFSVLRTGTGSLDLLAGGNVTETSPYGVYTAGTQSAAIDPAFLLPRGQAGDGTVLGAKSAYNDFVAGYTAYYPTGGGDVLVSAQGGVFGDTYVPGGGTAVYSATDSVGNWLWTQGGLNGQAAAWWINFGTYALPQPPGAAAATTSGVAALTGFIGIGALGGGNVTVSAGGDAGATTGRATPLRAQTLTVAVGGSGRVLDGVLTQTGGGDLTLNVGGALNGLAATPGGTLTDLRGELSVRAGSIGVVAPSYGNRDPVDTRAQDPFTATLAQSSSGLTIAPGDAGVAVSALRDLVLGAVADPGRLPQQNLTNVTVASKKGDSTVAGGRSWFTLWTADTAIDLFSAGGDLTPSTQAALTATDYNRAATDYRYEYPPTLRAVAASGNIFYGANLAGDPSRSSLSLELAPAAGGQLELLAGQSIYANGYTIDISGADPAGLPTPFNPAYSVNVFGGSANTSNLRAGANPYFSLFAFQPDTPSFALHAGDDQPARIYAAGDIVDFRFGEVLNFLTSVSPSIWYIAAKPAWIVAGRDIVASGTRPDPSTPPTASFFTAYPNQATGGVTATKTSGNLILNADPEDVSVIAAGRDILQTYAYVAGPGLLEVTAGRNLYQGANGLLKSIGPVTGVSGATRDSGAGITVLAGTGAAGPDYAGFAARYIAAADRAAFDALPALQQDIQLRALFYGELLASGREQNNPDSIRFRSYARGRDAIAALLPATDAAGAPIARGGDITLFSGTLGGLTQVFDAGISTQFGGDIQVINAGGQTVLGVTGAVQPGANSGLVTFGSGNIDIYSLGSVALGQSRIFTTFGGSILVWSATGDVNAGIGAKTAVLFQPPRISYDGYGSLILAPTAPTNGAGIATLTPIPGVPAGDVDLIAPLGTIDAGEAGIRVSGNLNLAALTVVNAANIQVQGKTTGVAVVAAPNLGAIAAASAAAGEAQNAATAAAQQQRPAAAQPAVITVEVVGFGDQL